MQVNGSIYGHDAKLRSITTKCQAKLACMRSRPLGWQLRHRSTTRRDHQQQASAPGRYTCTALWYRPLYPPKDTMQPAMGTVCRDRPSLAIALSTGVLPTSVHCGQAQGQRTQGSSKGS